MIRSSWAVLLAAVLLAPVAAQTTVHADTAWVAAFAEVAAPSYGAMALETADGMHLLDEGRALMIAFRLDEAEDSFRRLETVEPSNPAAAYHLTTIAFWRALMAEREPYYGRFFAINDSLLDRLDEEAEGPWKTHFEAEAQFQRTVIYAKQGRYPKAGLALRAAFGRYERNLREHPTFWESYKGMGLCHIAVGAVPRSYRWILSVLGFSGTVQQGLDELTQALQHSAYSREESALYLAVVDAFLNEHTLAAIRHVEALYTAYPESPMPAYLYAFLMLHAREAGAAEQAERILRAAADRQAPEAVTDIPYVDYFLADALFGQNNFEEAAPLYERYTRTYRGEALLAQAYLNAGLSREMLGDRERAVDHYERIESRRDYDSDASALRRARHLLEQPMTADERTLLLGQNLYDGGRFSEAITTLQPVLTDSDAERVHRAEAAYRTGRAYHAQGDLDEAFRHYRIAVDNPGDPLAKWGPWSQYHMGEVYEEQGDLDAARRTYRAVLDNEDEFDFHKALEQRTRTALGRL